MDQFERDAAVDRWLGPPVEAAARLWTADQTAVRAVADEAVPDRDAHPAVNAAAATAIITAQATIRRLDPDEREATELRQAKYRSLGSTFAGRGAVSRAGWVVVNAAQGPMAGTAGILRGKMSVDTAAATVVLLTIPRMEQWGLQPDPLERIDTEMLAEVTRLPVPAPQGTCVGRVAENVARWELDAPVPPELLDWAVHVAATDPGDELTRRLLDRDDLTDEQRVVLALR